MDSFVGLPILVVGMKINLSSSDVDGRDPQIHEVWTFGDDGVTQEVHPTTRVDVGAGFVR